MTLDVLGRLATGAAAAGALAASSSAGFTAEGQALIAAVAAAVAAWLWPLASQPAPAPAAEAAQRRQGRRRLPPGLAYASLQRMPSAVVIIDHGSRVLYANPSAQALFERLAVGEHYSMSFRSPDLLDALAQALENGASVSLEFALHGDRTRQIAAHVDGAALTGDGGEGPRRYVICMLQDRTYDMRVQRLRTDFIANASHELRTPLSSVKGFIETLQGAARDDPDARERFLAIMQSQAERMERLVDDLLSLSRIELNEHIAPDDMIDLGEIARETAEALGPMARQRGVALICEVEGAGPRVRGDRDQLIQAVGNLLENALKYGGGRPVRLHRRDPTQSRPGLDGIAVTDQGEGIPREHLPRLTERFYRVSAKRSRDQGGTGLGLAIVKHILARHRGELEIESEEGEGSRFTLWLPPAEPWCRDRAAAASSPAEPGPKKIRAQRKNAEVSGR
ncbi:MAG: ATP-binding protein [Pseudomonadota bacterium]